MRRTLSRVVPFAIAILFAAPAASQAQYYWDGTTSNSWNTVANYATTLTGGTNPSALPGSSDTVIFGVTPTTLSTANPRAINLNTVLGADFSIAGLQFNSAAGFGPTAVDIGVAAGTTQTLTLGSGGITIASGAGPASILNGVGITLNGIQTWTNNSSNTFTVASAITGGANNLTVTGSGSFLLSGGLTSTTGTLTKSGSGTLTLSGAGALGGATSITGGTLALNYATDNTVKLASGAGLTMGTGTLTITGNSGAATTETVSGLTLNGRAQINITSNNAGGATLALGTITPNAGGTVDFAYTNTTGTAKATSTKLNTATSILGGWATVNGTDWAVTGTSAGTYDVAALAAGSYTTTSGANPAWVAANDVSLSTTAATGISTRTINSLRLTAATTNTISASQTLTITSGGILVTAGASQINGVTTSPNMARNRSTLSE